MLISDKRLAFACNINIPYCLISFLTSLSMQNHGIPYGDFTLLLIIRNMPNPNLHGTETDGIVMLTPSSYSITWLSLEENFILTLENVVVVVFLRNLFVKLVALVTDVTII